MDSSNHHSRTPQRPVEGGRDAYAGQVRALRRLEARAAGERRQTGEAFLQDIPSDLSLPAIDTTVDGRTHSLASRLRAKVDATLLRPGRGGSR